MNSHESTQNISDAIQEAARLGGAFLLESQKEIASIQIKEKSKNQLVSEIDVNAEKIIVKALQNKYPSAGFITEEDTITHKKSELCFIIDPLDGTTNFLHNLPIYSVSIAATFQDELIAGVVYIPASQELFHAVKGNGAYLNNHSITVSQSQLLSDSLLATGFPYHAFEGMDAYIRSLEYLMQNTRGLRRMGSAAIDLAYTACGRFCGFFELNINTWDVAAGILLIQEAGGKVSTFNDQGSALSGKEIVASNPSINKELKRVLVNNFYL